MLSLLNTFHCCSHCRVCRSNHYHPSYSHHNTQSSSCNYQSYMHSPCCNSNTYDGSFCNEKNPPRPHLARNRGRWAETSGRAPWEWGRKIKRTSKGARLTVKPPSSTFLMLPGSAVTEVPNAKVAAMMVFQIFMVCFGNDRWFDLMDLSEFYEMDLISKPSDLLNPTCEPAWHLSRQWQVKRPFLCWISVHRRLW